MLETRKLHVHVCSRTESISTELTVGIAVFGDAHSATFILVALSLRIPSVFLRMCCILCEHSISEYVSGEQGVGGVDREDHVDRYVREHEHNYFVTCSCIIMIIWGVL